MTTTYVVPRGALMPLPPIPTHVELDLEADADEWDALMPHQAGLLRAIEEETQPDAPDAPQPPKP